MLFNSLRRGAGEERRNTFIFPFNSASSIVNFKDKRAMNILHNNNFVQNLVIKSQLVQLKVEKCSEESTLCTTL